MNENEYKCPYCFKDFTDANILVEHLECDHQNDLEKDEQRLSKISNENKKIIENYIVEQKRKMLLKISEQNPRLLHEIQNSPHADEMLEKMVSDDLFQKSLRVNALSSFDAMWMQHKDFNRLLEAQKEAKEAPEPAYELPDMVGKQENLSKEDVEKKRLVLILYSLLRKQKEKVKA